MAYLGTPIDTTNQFQSLQGKRFSGDGSTTAFTLDIAPSSVFDIEVFVENVRQDPNSAYGISGTTLTFTGAPPSGTNNIYVVHQAKAVGTINPTNDSVTASSIADDAVESEHLNDNIISGQTDIGAAIADSDLFLVDDGAGGTLRKTAASRIKTYIGGNTPAFAVRKTGGDQSYAQNTWTKVTFNTELLDTDNAFASDKFTVPSGEAGTYLFNVSIQMGSIATGSAYHIKLYKNGSDYTSLVQHATSDAEYPLYGGVQSVDLAAGDYIEVYGLTNGGSGNFINNKCQFTGFKLGA